MSDSQKLTAWAEELQNVRARLDAIAGRRVELYSQMRALEIQIAILRAREHELSRAVAELAVTE